MTQLVSLVPLGAGLRMLIKILLQYLGRVHAHCAELPHRKKRSIFAYSPMRVKDRTRGADHDQKRHRPDRNQDQGSRDEDQKDVNTTLDEPVAEQLRWHLVERVFEYRSADCLCVGI